MLLLRAKSVDLEICLTRSNTEIWSKYSVKFVQSLFFSTSQQQTKLNCPFGDKTHGALSVCTRKDSVDYLLCILETELISRGRASIWIVSRESDRFSLPIKFKVRTTSESVCNVPARTLTSKILLQVGAETNTLDGANRTEDTATGTVT